MTHHGMPFKCGKHENVKLVNNDTKILEKRKSKLEIIQMARFAKINPLPTN